MSVAAPACVGDALADIDTPALLLDLDAFESNLTSLHRYVSERGGQVRSHGKAHKCPQIARLQVAAGAIGVCCQKVGEAEVFVSAGIGDVLVSNVIVGEGKARRLAQLALRARVGVCVDSVVQVDQLGAAARQAGARLDVLIEVDVGARRCGITGEDEALVLAARIASFAPSLSLRGLQAYHGGAQHRRTPAERAQAVAGAAAAAARVRDALRAAGYVCDEVTGAGTGSYAYELASGVYTELQPGSYVLMDADYALNEPDADTPALAQALTVLCTVITVRPTHAVLDGGLKAFAVDSGRPRMVLPGWHTGAVSDEHTVIEPDADTTALAVGEKVRLVPGHCDPTVNLHDWIVAVRHGRVEGLWPVQARGALF